MANSNDNNNSDSKLYNKQQYNNKTEKNEIIK